MLKDFDNKDTESIKDKLNKLINNLSYEGISRFNEASYRDFLATLLLFSNASNIVKEHVNAQGRADLTFETENKAFVCEFKIAKNKAQVESLVNQAKVQIKDRKYNLLPTDKEVISYAIVVLHQKGEDRKKACYKIATIDAF